MEESIRLDSPSGALLPVLPLRDIVVFPYMIVPLFVGREKSVKALDSVIRQDQKVLLLTQKDVTKEDPKPRDLFSVGCMGHVLQLLKLPDGTVKVLVEGLQRAQALRFLEEDGFFQAYVEPINMQYSDSPETEALVRTSLSLFDQYIKLNSKIPPEVLVSVAKIEQSDRLADTISSHLNLKISEKQHILEIPDFNKQLEKVCQFMENEISILHAEKRIQGRLKRQMERSQREYYLNEKMKAIQKELNETEDGRDEAGELENAIQKTRFSQEARARALSELKKFKTMSPMSAEATVVRNYLDWLLNIPWKKPSKMKKDIEEAEQILDAQHYGLEKVKERIVEYLAVQNRVGKVRGPILCLVGPPGVGKTSLGRSIAQATGREFVRISLGGVRDEADIRGHRRTYIGSMPGRIIQGMKKAGTSNPLFLLDEVDKMGADWRGDPTAALLEVLDPEQNKAFNDHYLDVDYDLSDVLFVTTSNSLQMPDPLLDRLEIIRLSGYTEDEKIEIARRHLIPKQLQEHGLKEGEWHLEDSALRKIIRIYTREAGVRNLEREIAKLLRKATRKIVFKKLSTVTVTEDNLEEFLGIPVFHYGISEEEDLVGITTGLGWTQVGGDLLVIEALTLPGKGKITITGKLGEVMQESVQAAASFVRSHALVFGLQPSFFEKVDIHIHVPEGAIPKDGPSAGIAICTSIVSVLSGIPVRRDVAMTGEITLRGRVLPIGGLKEKLLAAHRGGIKKVLIPYDNKKDLTEIPENVKEGLEIVPVKIVDQVIEQALVRMPEPLLWTAPDQDHKTPDVSVAPSVSSGDDFSRNEQSRH